MLSLCTLEVEGRGKKGEGLSEKSRVVQEKSALIIKHSYEPNPSRRTRTSRRNNVPLRCFENTTRRVVTGEIFTQLRAQKAALSVFLHGGSEFRRSTAYNGRCKLPEEALCGKTVLNKSKVYLASGHFRNLVMGEQPQPRLRMGPSASFRLEYADRINRVLSEPIK